MAGRDMSRAIEDIARPIADVDDAWPVCSEPRFRTWQHGTNGLRPSARTAVARSDEQDEAGARGGEPRSATSAKTALKRAAQVRCCVQGQPQ